jgi:lipoprotein
MVRTGLKLLRLLFSVVLTVLLGAACTVAAGVLSPGAAQATEVFSTPLDSQHAVIDRTGLILTDNDLKYLESMTQKIAAKYNGHLYIVVIDNTDGGSPKQQSGQQRSDEELQAERIRWGRDFLQRNNAPDHAVLLVATADNYQISLVAKDPSWLSDEDAQYLYKYAEIDKSAADWAQHHRNSDAIEQAGINASTLFGSPGREEPPQLARYQMDQEASAKASTEADIGVKPGTSSQSSGNESWKVGIILTALAILFGPYGAWIIFRYLWVRRKQRAHKTQKHEDTSKAPSKREPSHKDSVVKDEVDTLGAAIAAAHNRRSQAAALIERALLAYRGLPLNDLQALNSRAEKLLKRASSEHTELAEASSTTDQPVNTPKTRKKLKELRSWVDEANDLLDSLFESLEVLGRLPLAVRECETAANTLLDAFLSEEVSHNFSVAEQQRAALRRTLRDRLETEDFAPLDYMSRVLEDTASLLAQEQKLIGSKARTKTQENLIGAHVALAEQYIACARISTKTQPVQDKQKTKPASANRLERAQWLYQRATQPLSTRKKPLAERYQRSTSALEAARAAFTKR